MKNIKSQYEAFTLLEILVVIAIIAILAAIITPTYYYAKDRARETKARLEVKALETAFRSYLDTYKTWPGDSKHPLFPDGPIDGVIFESLSGVQDSILNPQGICFYEFPSSENYSDQTTAYDPWANPKEEKEKQDKHIYQVKFDYLYANAIAGPDGQTIHRSVIVWSCGKNGKNDQGKWDENSNPPKDDIASW